MVPFMTQLSEAISRLDPGQGETGVPGTKFRACQQPSDHPRRSATFQVMKMQRAVRAEDDDCASREVARWAKQLQG